MECLNDWTTAVQDRTDVDVLYVDYSKAFDSVAMLNCYTNFKAMD